MAEPEATSWYLTGVSSLGAVLVVGTDAGVSMVSLADDEAALEAWRVEHAPTSRPATATGAPLLPRWLDAVLARIERPHDSHGNDGNDGDGASTLPLDLQGSAHQRRVWAALREIPVGATVTYTELAEKLGAASGARAVARACATNHLAVVVPCHRVLRQGGALSGYRWGLERKRALLAREGALLL